MTRVVCSSDLHLGHRGITKKFRPCFSSDEEHNNVIFDNLASVITKRDVLVLCGDVAFDKEWLHRLAEIKCLKSIIILGNHDTETHRHGITAADFTSLFDEVHGLVKKYDFWFSHCPVHPQELRGKRNIHGHTHTHNITGSGPKWNMLDENYFNICVDNTRYRPIDLQKLKTLVAKKPYQGFKEELYEECCADMRR